MNSLAGGMGPTSSLKNKVPKGYQQGTIQNYTPQQMQLFESMFGNVGPNSYTSRLAQGDESLFNEMEAPAFRQFNELQGQNASRFSGMGMGARRGSGFQNQQNAATSNFAQDLQSRRQELQRNAIKDLMGMSSDLLEQRPSETFFTKKSRPWWQELLTESIPFAGNALGSYFGNRRSNSGSEYSAFTNTLGRSGGQYGSNLA